MNLLNILKPQRNQKSFKTFFFAPFKTKQSLNKQISRTLLWGQTFYTPVKISSELHQASHAHWISVYCIWIEAKGNQWDPFLSQLFLNPLCPNAVTVCTLSLSILITLHVDWWSVSTVASQYTINPGSEQSDTMSLVKWLIVTFVYHIAKLFLIFCNFIFSVFFIVFHSDLLINTFVYVPWCSSSAEWNKQ